MMPHLLALLRSWLRARRLGGFAHTPPETGPAAHAAESERIARATQEMDVLEDAVSALAGRQGAAKRDQLVERVIQAQGRVFDALAAERWQFEDDLRRAERQEGHP